MFNSKSLLASTLVILLSFASATPAKLGTDASAGVEPAPELGTVFAVYPGWDMNNGETTEILNGTELACLQSCSATADCVAYAYSPYSTGGTGPVQPSCFLKNGLDLSTFQIRTLDLHTGRPTSCFTVTVPM
ncbi:hypothetical protein C8R44DRAFT_821975 [Mycena epipterygia]|nr:hypothetical protein C8R44DRAFT_821975 [Mycena epipterygia]